VIAVVDASVLVDALPAKGDRGGRALGAIESFDLYAPGLVRVETISGLRKHLRRGSLTEPEARGAVRALLRLELQELSVEPLIVRIWELRDNLTAADASYVALAEQLRARVITCDARMANAPGTRCEFQLIE
jgi:predicted nucleic acid-binding protein